MTGTNNREALTITHPAFLVEGSDAEFRILINRLLYFCTRLLSVRDGFGTLLGLSGIQYSILMSVRALSTDEEVTVNQLADHLHLSGSFITIETGKLQNMGLLKKRRHAQDGRKIVLSITREGKKVLTQLTDTQQTINDLLFANLSATEAKMLGNIAGRLVSNVDSAMLELSHLVSKNDIRQEAAARAAAG
jgi:MarR family transcriptional regulator, organic hydroperoxide resistance regulator